MQIGPAWLPLLGHWQGREEQHESAWGPASTARSAVTFKLDVGGLVVVQDYRQVRADGAEFLGHGVFLAPEPGQVLWWFFDSVGLPPDPAQGTWRDAELRLTKITSRGVAVHRYGLADVDLAYLVDVGPSVDDLKPFLRGRYRRLDTH